MSGEPRARNKDEKRRPKKTKPSEKSNTAKQERHLQREEENLEYQRLQLELQRDILAQEDAILEEEKRNHAAERRRQIEELEDEREAIQLQIQQQQLEYERTRRQQQELLDKRLEEDKQAMRKAQERHKREEMKERQQVEDLEEELEALKLRVEHQRLEFEKDLMAMDEDFLRHEMKIKDISELEDFERDTTKSMMRDRKQRLEGKVSELQHAHEQQKARRDDALEEKKTRDELRHLDEQEREYEIQELERKLEEERLQHEREELELMDVLDRQETARAFIQSDKVSEAEKARLAEKMELQEQLRSRRLEYAEHEKMLKEKLARQKEEQIILEKEEMIRRDIARREEMARFEFESDRDRLKTQQLQWELEQQLQRQKQITENLEIDEMARTEREKEFERLRQELQKQRSEHEQRMEEELRSLERERQEAKRERDERRAEVQGQLEKERRENDRILNEGKPDQESLEQTRRKSAKSRKSSSSEVGSNHSQAQTIGFQTQQAADAPGIYKVIEEAIIEKKVDRGSTPVGELTAGKLIRVLEIVHTEDRIRGKLEKPAGWISILDKNDGYRWAEPAADAPGMYKMEEEAIVEKLVERGSKPVAELEVGEVVRVLEIVHTEDRIRGKLEKPKGWISLMDKSDGFRWAVQLLEEKKAVSLLKRVMAPDQASAGSSSIRTSSAGSDKSSPQSSVSKPSRSSSNTEKSSGASRSSRSSSKSGASSQTSSTKSRSSGSSSVSAASSHTASTKSNSSKSRSSSASANSSQISSPISRSSRSSSAGAISRTDKPKPKSRPPKRSSSASAISSQTSSPMSTLSRSSRSSSASGTSSQTDKPKPKSRPPKRRSSSTSAISSQTSSPLSSMSKRSSSQSGSKDGTKGKDNAISPKSKIRSNQTSGADAKKKKDDASSRRRSSSSSSGSRSSSPRGSKDRTKEKDDASSRDRSSSSSSGSRSSSPRGSKDRAKEKDNATSSKSKRRSKQTGDIDAKKKDNASSSRRSSSSSSSSGRNSSKFSKSTSGASSRTSKASAEGKKEKSPKTSGSTTSSGASALSKKSRKSIESSRSRHSSKSSSASRSSSPRSRARRRSSSSRSRSTSSRSRSTSSRSKSSASRSRSSSSRSRSSSSRRTATTSSRSSRPSKPQSSSSKSKSSKSSHTSRPSKSQSGSSKSRSGDSSEHASQKSSLASSRSSHFSTGAARMSLDSSVAPDDIKEEVPDDVEGKKLSRSSHVSKSSISARHSHVRSSSQEQNVHVVTQDEAVAYWNERQKMFDLKREQNLENAHIETIQEEEEEVSRAPPITAIIECYHEKRPEVRLSKLKKSDGQKALDAQIAWNRRQKKEMKMRVSDVEKQHMARKEKIQSNEQQIANHRSDHIASTKGASERAQEAKDSWNMQQRRALMTKEELRLEDKKLMKITEVKKVRGMLRARGHLDDSQRAALKIQIVWMAKRYRKQFLKRRRSVVFIQDWWRRRRRGMGRPVDIFAQSFAKRQRDVFFATKIQAAYRGFKARRRVSNMRYFANLEHETVRAKERLQRQREKAALKERLKALGMVHEEHQKKHNPKDPLDLELEMKINEKIHDLQKGLVANEAKLKSIDIKHREGEVRGELKSEINETLAALMIQRKFRGMLGRRRVQKMRDAKHLEGVRVEMAKRAALERKQQLLKRKQEAGAAKRIQALFRGRRARKLVEAMKSDIVSREIGKARAVANKAKRKSPHDTKKHTVVSEHDSETYAVADHFVARKRSESVKQNTKKIGLGHGMQHSTKEASNARLAAQEQRLPSHFPLVDEQPSVDRRMMYDEGRMPLEEKSTMQVMEEMKQKRNRAKMQAVNDIREQLAAREGVLTWNKRRDIRRRHLAATRIQREWRSILVRRRLEKTIAKKRQKDLIVRKLHSLEDRAAAKKDKAATTIQRIFRGRLGRLEAQSKRSGTKPRRSQILNSKFAAFTREQAAIKIQKVFRGKLGRDRHHELESRKFQAKVNALNSDLATLQSRLRFMDRKSKAVEKAAATPTVELQAVTRTLPRELLSQKDVKGALSTLKSAMKDGPFAATTKAKGRSGFSSSASKSKVRFSGYPNQNPAREPTLATPRSVDAVTVGQIRTWSADTVMVALQTPSKRTYHSEDSRGVPPPKVTQVPRMAEFAGATATAPRRISFQNLPDPLERF